MFEVEAKVPITRGDVSRLRKIISKWGSLKGKSVKTDCYYGMKGKHFLRIRTKNGQNPVLTAKRKGLQGGVEMNLEVDLPLTSLPKMHRFLESIGFPLLTKKQKISEVYTVPGFQIELNRIPGLGYYLEIESQARRKADIPKARRRVEECFQKLGFSPSQFEKRYYLDLLAEKHV